MNLGDVTFAPFCPFFWPSLCVCETQKFSAWIYAYWNWCGSKKVISSFPRTSFLSRKWTDSWRSVISLISCRPGISRLVIGEHFWTFKKKKKFQVTIHVCAVTEPFQTRHFLVWIISIYVMKVLLDWVQGKRFREGGGGGGLIFVFGWFWALDCVRASQLERGSLNGCVRSSVEKKIRTTDSASCSAPLSVATPTRIFAWLDKKKYK